MPIRVDKAQLVHVVAAQGGKRRVQETWGGGAQEGPLAAKPAGLRQNPTTQERFPGPEADYRPPTRHHGKSASTPFAMASASPPGHRHAPDG